jgi:iron(III) transport system substrate-binding protein
MSMLGSRPLASIASIFLLALAACAPSAAPARPSSAPAAAPAPTSEWDRIVEEAKREGEVIVWGPAGADLRRHNKEAFERAYPGIRVTLFQAPSNSERDSRYLQEFQAGVARVDVMVGGAGGANARLKPAGALQDLRPFLIQPEVTDATKWRDGKLSWVDTEETYFLQSDMRITPNLLVNESVAPAAIQHWEDLLSLRWKGQMVMTDPRKSGDGFAMGLFMYYTPELGPDYVRRFFGEMDVTFSQESRQNVEWVNSGRMLINVRPDNREVTKLLDVGGTVQVIPALKARGKAVDSSGGSDGILFIPNLNPLPHPNAAKVYVNWFYSRDGQQAMVDILERASRRVDVSLASIPEYARPQPGVEYMNLNHYTEQSQVEAMRDEVAKAYGK